MLNGKTVAVVVPSYNEEKQITMVLDDMPSFVDRIIVVNDCSKDATADVIVKYLSVKQKSRIKIQKKDTKILSNRYNKAMHVAAAIIRAEDKLFTPSVIFNRAPESDRIILINHTKNGGVGAAIATGYKWCRDHEIDCTAVMAGDGQMDPAELESLCRPVIDDGVDYVKGNRLIHRSAWLVVPKIRYFGNSILSMFTKIASGYWHVSDTQTGYTAISQKALNAIRLHTIYPRYGMPNDMLVKLNIALCSVKEVEIKPVYAIGEKSKMRIMKVIPRILGLLCISFFKRLWIKYLFRDFHPVFLFYHFAILLGVLVIPLALKICLGIINNISITYQTLIVFIFISISCLQSLFFAMWMDIQDNERLYK